MKRFIFLFSMLTVFVMSVIAANYEVVGASLVCNGQNWNNDAAENLMTTSDNGVTYSLTITGLTLESGTPYEYKIVEKGSWTEYYPNTNGSNASFTVPETAVYTIKYVFTVSTSQCEVQKTKTGNAGEVTHTYTVAGNSTVLFGTEWDPSNTANDMTLADGVYTWSKSDVALAAGSFQFKCVQDHSWDVAYPGSNYEAAIPEDGNYDVVITLGASNHEVNCTLTKKGSAVITHANPDLNGDGKVNNSDYDLLAKALVSGTYTAAYDLDGDGRLDAVDANLLRDQFGSCSYFVNGVTFKMVAVAGGTFTMGSDAEGSDEKPAHEVTLDDFIIGETEVTEALWTAVMGSNPSKFKKGDNYPVETVSWNDCQTFISKLNELTGETFRLPTEAEWEYAARGGNQSQGYEYAGSNTIGDVAWYNDSNSSAKHPVATKAPNELGLYDMSGNVWEWCQDWYDPNYYSSSPTVNPTGPTTGSFRVVRGGSWGHYAWDCRVSRRGINKPSDAHGSLGLRLVLKKIINI